MATKPEKSDLKNLSIREIVIIGVTLLGAVGYGFIEFEYNVQTKKIKQIEAQLTETQALIGAIQKIMVSPARNRKTSAQIKKIEEEIVELQTAIKKTKTRLTGQGLEILNEFQSKAGFFGVFLKSIKTSENNLFRGGLQLKEVSVTRHLVCEKSSPQMRNFVSRNCVNPVTSYCKAVLV